MKPRWWEPSGAHIGPDDADLALLSPGTDPALDLGNQLLALHRVGAAACKSAAATPLVDAGTLADRLVAAREATATPAVSAVAKSMGSAVYADLLCRDYLDAADDGALKLFRAAVSKGVPAPIAADRAGMVYGVPFGQLGRFRPLALDPRANPVALVDAADRVLIEHVRKTVEAEDFLEEVSKAPAVTDRPWVATEARDDLGRWTDADDAVAGTAAGMSLDEWLAQTLATGPAQVGAKARAERKPRVARTARLARLARVKKPDEATTTARAVTGREVSTRPVSARAQALRRIAAADAGEELPTNASRRQRKPPADYLERVADTGDYSHAVGGDVGFTLPVDEWSTFRAHAPEGHAGTDRVFRTHALIEYHQQPVVHKVRYEGAEQLTGASDALAAYTVEQLAQEYTTEPVSVEYRRGDKRQDVMEAKADLVGKFWEDWGSTPEAIGSDAETEMRHVKLLEDYADPERWHLVYYPPPDDADEDYDFAKPRAAAQLVTAVIPEAEAKGNVNYWGQQHRTNAETDFRLDPNAGWRVPGDPLSFRWDAQVMAMRTDVTLEPVAEEEVLDDLAEEHAERQSGRSPYAGGEWTGGWNASKALTAERFATLEAEGRETRDGTGRFAPHEQAIFDRLATDALEGQFAITHAPEQTRTARVARVARTARVARVQTPATTTSREVTGRQVSARPVGTRALGAKKLTVRHPDTGEEFSLHDDGVYQVWDTRSFNKLLGAAGVQARTGRTHPVLRVSGSVHLDGEALRLLEAHGTDVENQTVLHTLQTSANLTQETAAETYRRKNPGKATGRLVYAGEVQSDEGMAAVEAKVRELFARDPRMSVVELVPTRNESTGHWEVDVIKPGDVSYEGQVDNTLQQAQAANEQAILTFDDSALEDWGAKALTIHFEHTRKGVIGDGDYVDHTLRELWQGIHARPSPNRPNPRMVAEGQPYRIFRHPVGVYYVTAADSSGKPRTG